MDELLLLGKNTDGSEFSLPKKALRKHVVTLGASGSGKTVFCKCIIEEAVRNSVPAIIIDPQGDIASLAIPGKGSEIEDKGTSKNLLEDYKQKAEVRIFTPASKKGLALSVNPLKIPSNLVDEEEKIRTIDLMSSSVVRLINYDIETEMGKAANAFLFKLLQAGMKRGTPITDLDMLANYVDKPDMLININEADSMLNKKERDRLAKNIRFLTTGVEQLLFSIGTSVNMDLFLTPVTPGKVPVNIIYLNTLNKDEHKQFFVTMIGNEIYNWMLSHPKEDVQLIFYIDEVSTYLPPHPRNPPAKEILKLLFKQARKYGVSCMMSTQNPSDIDYKAMSQASTWALGRMMTEQDKSKIDALLISMNSGSSDRRSVVDALSTLKPGEFILVSPDFYDKPQRFKTRWLVTEHRTLDEESLRDYIDDNIEDFFSKKSTQKASHASAQISTQQVNTPIGSNVTPTPSNYGRSPEYLCATCRTKLEYIYQYRRWYCRGCNKYL
ncbi:MAG: ATP-binding protein [Thermoplasmata archaeon]